MADLPITQAVSQAEEAIETGNYDSAIETCQRILGQFPEFAAAHRILGEAYAEQGELEAAKQSFQRTLERDPQSVAAHVGLGFIAEETNDRQAALAHFQVAWEIDPRRRDLRDHVSRLSQEIYGEDGRLYLTRAALTSLHFHAGRWDRAVSEAAQVLQEFSSRIDVQVRMAEALWRRGDDEQAMQVCNAILRTLPLAVVPLLIQADIHRRQGNDAEAQDLLSQARAIDPDGVRAADLIIVGLDDQADFLMVDEPPTIDESVLTEEPAARYAPAPDFTAEEPAPAEDAGPQPAEAVDDAARWDAAVEGTDASEIPASEPQNLQPFRWEDIGDEDLEVSDLDLTGEAEPEGPDAASEPDEPAADQESVPFELYTDEEIDQARPTGEHPAGFTGYLRSLDSEGMEPFRPDVDVDEDIADVVPEPESTPAEPDETPAGETDEAEDVWAQFEQEVESGGEPAEPAESPEPDPLELDWDRVDQEIEEAIPGETPRGYTDEFRDLDSTGFEPFTFDDESGDDIVPDEIAEAETGDTVAGETVEDVEAEPEADVEAESIPDDVDFDELTKGWEEETPGESETAVLEPRDETVDDVSALFGEFDQPVDDTEEAGDEQDLVLEPEPEFVAEADQESIEVFEPEPEPEPEPGTEQLVSEFSAAESWVAEETQPVDIAEVQASIERIGLDESLIERARVAKSQLIHQGRITGNDRLPGMAPSIDDLQAAVDAEPDNVDHRIALAAALIEVDTNRALEQFRWIYRNGGDRGQEIVEDLNRLIETAREQEVGAHRLLAALYRRHGDWLAAANHYEESLIVRRRS